jgi:energy-coupling factor transport system permease protein
VADASPARRIAVSRPRIAGDVHPAAWLAWAACAAAVAFVTTNPWYLGTAIAIAWFVYASCRIDGPTARSFRVFLVAGVIAMALRTALVLFGPVVPGSVVAAALEGMRLAALLAIFGAFNAVTDPFGVVRLAPRRFHEPALAAALALSIAPRTIASVHRVREAQAIRGLPVAHVRGLPSLAVPVLATGLEEAMTLAESMDARGHGRGRRTRYRPSRWTPAAIAVVVAGAVAATTFLTVAFGSGATLHPSTFPLRMPAVDPWLLVVECLLVLPAFVLARSTRTDVPA